VRAGISKRALAKRAGTSPAAIVLYESGQRDPTMGTLTRVIRATGAVVDLDLDPEPALPDRARCARSLEDVLGLADNIPLRPPTPQLRFPPFPRRRPEPG
jgi:transcriptional regulator with XRE-family HTH domain